MSTILRKETWLDHVDSWKKSGLSINKYCKENGLKSSSFHYWIKEAGKETYRSASAGKLVKLEIPESITTNRTQGFSLKYSSFRCS